VKTIKATIKKDIKDETGANKGYHKLAGRVQGRMGKAAHDALMHIADEEAMHKAELKILLAQADKKKASAKKNSKK
jgi:rubrerythrin